MAAVENIETTICPHYPFHTTETPLFCTTVVAQQLAKEIAFSIEFDSRYL
jgi:hypothetical protein